MLINKMYQNPYGEKLSHDIDVINQRKVRNIEAIDSGAGVSGTRSSSGGANPEFARTIGGRRRGRPSKKSQMQGEGFLGSIGGLVDNIFGLGAPSKMKGQRKYKKQAEEPMTCGGSGFASGSHMDTGFGATEGAGGSGGRVPPPFSKSLSPEDQEKLMYAFFGKGKGKKIKEKLEGAGFWSDFADGFVKGFTGAADVGLKVLPFITGLGKPPKTTRTDLEQMGRYIPDKTVLKSQLPGSDMSGFGKRSRKSKCMCEGEGFSGGADKFKPINFDDEDEDEELASIMANLQVAPKPAGKRRVKRVLAPSLVPSMVPAKRMGETLMSPRRKTRVVEGEGSSGGRRTETEGDFSGGNFYDTLTKMSKGPVNIKRNKGIFGDMIEKMSQNPISSGGAKKAPNAWLQLVNKVRKEQGFKGVKDAIKYIKEHNLYHK